MPNKFLIPMLFFCQLLLAQDPFYINYSTSEGLPSAMVYSVFRDDKNFLWFTTDAGVVKYDSHSFTLFNTDNGLSDNEVFQMKRDHKGRIWFLTLNGKPCFLYRNKIYNENNSAFLKKISSADMFRDFFEDSDNNSYFVYRANYVSILKANGTIVKMALPEGSFQGGWKKADTLFLSNDVGIFNTHTKTYTHTSLSPFRRVYHTSDRVFISDFNNLYQADGGRLSQKIVTLPEATDIIQIFVENDHKLWLCTRNGVYLRENGTLRKFFTGQVVSSMTKDFEGGYWMTTLKNGIIYVPSFDVYEKQFSPDAKLKLNCISINDKKEIWIGSDKDAYYVKKPHADFETHLLPVGLVPQFNEINNIRFFEGSTYVANKSCLLKIPEKGQPIYYRLSLNDLLIDDTNIYLGGGLCYKVPKTQGEILENYRFGLKNPHFLLDKYYEFLQKRAKVFCKGEAGDVWIGSNFGLYHYNNGDELLEFMGEKDDRLRSTIQAILYDQQNKLVLVASNSMGIIVLKDNKIIKQFTKANGINSNSCNSIAQLPGKNYLIGSNKGLNLLGFHNGRYTIRNLNTILGLKNKKINGISYLDGMVYLIANKSLLYFNLKSIHRKKTLPICHISSFKAGDRIIAPKNRYRFGHDNNDISINFIGISYIDQNLKYYYKLDGRDKHWEATNETQINYKSLAAGKYRFLVYCSDGFGVKSHTKQVSFEIEPPYWQEPWFLLLVTVLFALLIYAFIRYRLRLQRRRFDIEKAVIQTERDKAQLEKEMIGLEQKALRLQMNPHFIFNALNTIKGYYSQGDAIQASAYISKFSKLLRMLLENTQQAIPLDKEIEMLDLYITLTKIRYEDKFEYELYVDDTLNRSETAIPTLLLQPIVENAIIHGLAPKQATGLLKVSFLKKGKLLQCIIEDNGIGREASNKSQRPDKMHESKAIAITKERIALFSENEGQASFEIIDLSHNGTPSGTKVIITIPLISIW